MCVHGGVPGWIGEELRGTTLPERVREIPRDRLLIETDAPFLVPRTMPTKPKDGRNEPAFLPYVLQAVADCLGKPVPAVAEATTETAREFFRLFTPFRGKQPSICFLFLLESLPLKTSSA